MSREITHHAINPCNEALRVRAIDAPGPGGASHRYEVSGFDTASNPSRRVGEGSEPLLLLFQNGPVKDAGGVNGVTHEALLAVLIDRMEAFQAGPYACHENGEALSHLDQALRWLHRRTQWRQAAGVEGTMAKAAGDGVTLPGGLRIAVDRAVGPDRAYAVAIDRDGKVDLERSGALHVDAPAGEAIGRIAYEAYAGSTGWKSAVSGAPLPQWDQQAPAIRAAWCVAAAAAKGA